MSRPNQPLDPTKDKRVMAAFYGVQPSPVDDSIWGQSMDVGFSRMDQPGYIIHLIPGSNPAETALAELFLPPDEGYGSRGIDLDHRRRGVDGALERPHGELRPPQMQGADQRSGRDHRARCARKAGRSTSSRDRSSRT